MAFPTAFLDELRTRVALADIVGKRVRLIRRGREHTGLCPFHKEKTPSFTVNEEKGFYHCFGCGKHGSVIDFVMETEGLSFPEAVERLARDAGMELPERDSQSRVRDESRTSLLAANEAAAAFFEKSLKMPEGRRALDYLRERGLTDQTIATFRLGFAPDRRDALKAALIREGFPEDRLVEAGVLIRPPASEGEQNAGGARGTYDRFRGRVMFPITDRQGRVIAFGGRILGDGEPKYLNSPETPLFHKGANLYALSHALAAVRAKGTLAVVEGYMDAIQLHQAGIMNVVAPLGTALTEEQIMVLWKLAPEPVLCFDGDNAGQRAALRAADRALPILKAGYSLRFAFMPAGEDPDSLVRRHGVDAARKILAAAIPLSETLWLSETTSGFPETPEARAALEARLRRHAARIQDASLRDHFTQAFRERLRGEMQAARERKGGFGKGGFGKGGPRKNTGLFAAGGLALRAALATTADAGLQAERILIALAVNHPPLFAEIEETLGSTAFADPALDRLRQALLRALAQAPEGWEAADVPGLLGEGGMVEMLDQVLSHPLVKTHRMVQPDAPLAEARATWLENVHLHAHGREEPASPASEGEDGALTEESWERRRAALAARLSNGEAAE